MTTMQEIDTQALADVRGGQGSTSHYSVGKGFGGAGGAVGNGQRAGTPSIGNGGGGKGVPSYNHDRATSGPKPAL